MFSRFSRPVLIAHRGACTAAPENTMAAFQLAVRQGAQVMELDAKLSADGEVVVIHDRTVNRTTNGQGRIDQLTLQQIKSLDAGSWFEGGNFSGERVPTLEEVLAEFGKNIVINIELTNYAHIFDDLPAKAAAIVRRQKLEDRVFFSSFNPFALMRTRSILLDVPCGLLAFPGFSGKWARGWIGRLLGFDALHPEKADVTQKLIEQTRKSKRPVFVYTVNQTADMRRLFQLGVDGIFTDDIPLAQKTLEEMGDFQ